MKAPASQHPGKADLSPRCLLSEGSEGPEDGGFCFGKDSGGETPWRPLTRRPSHGPPEAAACGCEKPVDGGQQGSDHQAVAPVGPRQSTSSLRRPPGHVLPVCPSREDPAMEGGVWYPRQGSGCQHPVSSRSSRGTWVSRAPQEGFSPCSSHAVETASPFPSPITGPRRKAGKREIPAEGGPGRPMILPKASPPEWGFQGSRSAPCLPPGGPGAAA